MREIATLLAVFILVFSTCAFGDDDKTGKARDEINQDVDKVVREVKKGAEKSRDEVNKSADKIFKKNGKDSKKEDKKEEKKEDKQAPKD
jgi:hypothetical protein